jgi:hypothetical protein
MVRGQRFGIMRQQVQQHIIRAHRQDRNNPEPWLLTRQSAAHAVAPTDQTREAINRPRARRNRRSAS